MELHDPVAIFTAASDIEAYEIVALLEGNGITARVIEDNSTVGDTVGVMFSASHSPRVWVSSADLERAAVVIKGLEARTQERQLTNQVQVDLQSEWIDARCDKCGTVTRYAPVEKGTVVNCPSCYAFMDVGGDVDFDDWNVIEVEGEAEAESGDEESE